MPPNLGLNNLTLVDVYPSWSSIDKTHTHFHGIDIVIICMTKNMLRFVPVKLIVTGTSSTSPLRGADRQRRYSSYYTL